MKVVTASNLARMLTSRPAIKSRQMAIKQVNTPNGLRFACPCGRKVAALFECSDGSFRCAHCTK